MSFKNDIPDYAEYCDSSEFYLSTVPKSAWEELSGLTRRSSNDANTLKAILNAWAEIIPCEMTNNWGYNFLENDISGFINKIRKKVKSNHINVFMDCVTTLTRVGSLPIDDINEFLCDNNIGYILCKDELTRELHWELREGIDSTLEKISSMQNLVKTVSQQAYEEFERAKNSIKDLDSERARKDTVRSCLSAMEAIVKEYGGKKDIKEASKVLRNDESWGRKDIVKQGNAIFGKVQELHPDLRHGSTEKSTMSKEEAEYWIGRIAVYLEYMKKMADKNGIL